MLYVSYWITKDIARQDLQGENETASVVLALTLKKKTLMQKEAQWLGQAHGIKRRLLSPGTAHHLSLPMKLCQDGWAQRSISGRWESMVNQLTSSPYHDTCAFLGRSSFCQGMVVLGKRSLVTSCSRLVSLPTQGLTQGRLLQTGLIHTGRGVLYCA